jgi:thiol-disulfide isomerase/thioredoxin
MKKYLLGTLLAASIISLVAFMNFPGKKSDSVKVTIPRIGDIAPEIALNNPEGKVIKLSSLRGKYVILDFWASWCGPCRRMNPSLVRVYKEYATKKFDNADGLTVFSVSLDKDKDAWLAAIKSDRLEWQEHVCDFMGWQSRTAGVFGVESIPYNFILDGDGRILAMDLQDQALSNFLKSKEKK